MRIIQKIKEYLNCFEAWLDEEEVSYDYGCLMIYFEFPEIKAIHAIISKQDIFVDPTDLSYGLEKQPHVTLLYGLHSGEISDKIIWDIAETITNSPLKLHTVSLFKNDRFNVLKFDVEGNGLHECNRMLKLLPHTTSYPDYHPHSTIAYLKPGICDKYINMLNGKSYTVTPSYIVYSKANGKKIMKKI